MGVSGEPVLVRVHWLTWLLHERSHDQSQEASHISVEFNLFESTCAAFSTNSTKPEHPANRAMAVGYAAWAHSVQDVADHYRVDLHDGLTENQVTAAREQYGRNELEKQPGKPLWKLVLEQFDDMLVKVSSRRQLQYASQTPAESFDACMHRSFSWQLWFHLL